MNRQWVATLCNLCSNYWNSQDARTWYNIGMVCPVQKEMPMSQAPQAPNQEQLLLFQPRPTRPSWKTLPDEVRKQTIELLTTMLREHWTRIPQAITEREASDE